MTDWWRVKKCPGVFFFFFLTDSISFYQEVDLACELLLHEGRRLNPGLGELVPVAVHPGQAGSAQVLGEEERGHGRRRRVFLTSGPNEDFFWAVGSIGFIVDAGLEKRNASFSFGVSLKVPAIRNNTESLSTQDGVVLPGLQPPDQNRLCHHPANQRRPSQEPPAADGCDR